MSTQAAAVQAQFAPNAERYARATYFGKQESLDVLTQVLNPQKHFHVLDIATGGGHCAFHFAPHVAQVTATDVTPEMLDAARTVAQEHGLANISFAPADAELLPYPNDHADLVTCRIAAHHFGDAGQAVREMARVCKRGGKVGLIDPIVPTTRRVADEVNNWEIQRDPSTVGMLTVTGWSALFCAAGLDVVHVSTYDIPLDFDDLLSRSSRDTHTKTQLRHALLHSSPEMRGWLKPVEHQDGTLTFVFPQILIVGVKP